MSCFDADGMDGSKGGDGARSGRRSGMVYIEAKREAGRVEAGDVADAGELGDCAGERVVKAEARVAGAARRDGEGLKEEKECGRWFEGNRATLRGSDVRADDGINCQLLQAQHPRDSLMRSGG